MAKLGHSYLPLYAGAQDLLVIVNAFNEKDRVVFQQVLKSSYAPLMKVATPLATPGTNI